MTQVRDVIGAPPLRRFISGWTAPLLPQGLSADAPVATPASPRFDWAGEVARATGTVFHRCAERLAGPTLRDWDERSDEHTSELPSLMRNSAAGFCMKTKTN